MTRQKMRLLAAIIILGAAIFGITSAQAQDSGEAADNNKIDVDGSTTVGPIAKAFAEYYTQENPGVNITVSESGSGNGAKSLRHGTCDVAIMSRFMKESEFMDAARNGIMPVAHVVAMDGLPVLVHPSNPVGALQLEQIRDIYTGKITNWKELGGPDREIIKISRDTNSGTFETFNTIVMQKEKMAQNTEKVGSNGAVRARVQSTPAAIGYAGLGFVSDTVKALEINGIYPDLDTVSSGKYPISRPLFMFTNEYPKLGTHLHSYVTLYLTEEGQEIVEDIGFVPVTQY